MKQIRIISCLLAFFCLLLSGCSKDLAPGDYDAAEVGKVKKVVSGMIISRRPVNVHAKTAENVAMPTDGSVATPSSSDTDNNVMRSHGFEYVIKLNSGAIISIVQTEDVRLKARQHVLVIYGNNTRVVPDEGNDDY